MNFAWLDRVLMGVLVLGTTNFAAAQVRVIEGEYIYKKPIVAAEVAAFGEDKPQVLQLLKKYPSGTCIASAESKIVDFDPNDSTCSDLLLSGEATFCEPNFYVEKYVASNDPLSSELYGLSLMGASNAWNVSTGSSNVVVAVIDTGIDYRHPDLVQNVWDNPGEIAGNGIDDDGNGWVDDIHGINAFVGSGDPLDDNGHGTHVSGTIGAVGNNSLGVVGINWNVKIMGLKFLSAGGGGSIFGAIQAIDYMIDAKKRYGLNLQVSNNSWGGAGYSQALEEAIARANNAGIVFVAAAGNESNNNDLSPAYPANYDLPNVVSVAAIDSAKSLAFFSNYGINVDIAAPGVSILSTLLNANYGKLSGTSMATPHVAGALALLVSNNPNLGVAGLVERLYSSAIPVSGLSGKVRTAGMLNVAGMLGASSNPAPAPISDEPVVSKLSLRTTDGSVDINPGDGLRISVTARASVAEISVNMFLNNKKCEQAKVVSLSAGINRFRARAGLLISGINKLSIQVGDRKTSKGVVTYRYGKRISARKVSSSNLKATCGRISRSIH